jgi:integrase
MEDRKNLKVKIKSIADNRFMVEYYHPLSKKRMRLRFNTYKEAVQYRRELEDTFQTEDFNPYKDRLIGDLIELHLAECPDTYFDQRKKHFISFYNDFCNMKLHQLQIMDLKKWFNKTRNDHDLADLTLISIRGNFSHFFNFLIDIGAIKFNPLLQIKFNRKAPPKTPRVYLTASEIKQVLENAKEYSPVFIYPYLYLIAHTGARRQEVLDLKWSNVDFKRSTLTLIETKNKVNRTIKMSDHLYRFMEKLPKDKEWVITNPDGKHVGNSQLSRHIVSFKNAYPIGKNWNSHSFRHSFAYNFLLRGGHMYELQAILGHKSIQLTIDLYGQLRSEDIENPSPFDF